MDTPDSATSKEPVVYRCGRCGYQTNIKCCLQQHFERKKPCPPLCEDIDMKKLRDSFCSNRRDPEKYPFECKMCKRRFTCSQGLSQHKRQFCKGNDVITKLQNQVDTLKQELQQNNEILQLHNQNASLQLKIKDLELAVRLAKEDKREETYQQLLQKYKFPGYTHMKVRCGVTDITTDAVHAEIKRYTCWKDAIGQVMAYNTDHPRPELHIYLFGKCTEEKKQHVTSIIHRLNIKPFEVKVIDNQFIIADLVQGTEEHFEITV